MTSLDQPAAQRPSVGHSGAARALHCLPSATLAVGSAAAFLILVTLLSFVPEHAGADRVAVDPSVDRAQVDRARADRIQADRIQADRAADAAAGWRLRGSLPAADPLSRRERVAQRAPS